jgi:phosphoglycerol transferase MdoB-like AlkP superfamily enzyme
LPKADYDRLYNYDPYTDSIKNINDPTYIPVDYYAYELNRKVPFIIWTKDNQRKKEITKVMGMVDALPTLGNMFDFRSNYQLGHDIFSTNNNVVVFANGNWLTDQMYYNSQKDEYKLLKQGIVSQDDIDKNNQYSSDVLDVSNDIILYDYIRKSKESESLLKEYQE